MPPWNVHIHTAQHRRHSMAQHSTQDWSTYQVEPNIGRKNLILFVLTEENHHVGELLQFLCPGWDT